MTRESVFETVCEGVVFTDVDWEEVIDAEFHSCTFVGADLHEALARNTRFVDCRFEGSDLSLWRPTDSSLGGSRVQRLPDARNRLDIGNLAARIAPRPEPVPSLRPEHGHVRQSRPRSGGLRGVPVAGGELPGGPYARRPARWLRLPGCRLPKRGLAGSRSDERRWTLVDPRTTELAGATVDAATGVAILEMLGIKLGEEFAGELPGPV